MSALNPNQSYLQTGSFTLPQGIAGNYYVIVKTDRYSYVPEGDNNNNVSYNTVPMVVNLTPPPDLQVNSIITPNNAFSGQQVSLTWTIKNEGTGETDATSWFDRVYLSEDAILNTNTDIPGRSTLIALTRTPKR